MRLLAATVVICAFLHYGAANLGTLRTFQAAACDNDQLQLKCPQGTRIAVELARYGRIGNQEHVCPQPTSKTQTRQSLRSYTLGTCLLPTAQQTVIAMCQSKSECHFLTNTSLFQGDPCPGERKYVEVAYKCRPFEFRSRLVCQGERMRLTCNINSRIAIFTAIFGRARNDRTSCVPNSPQGSDQTEESCFSSYATQTAMQQCHGRRTCDLSASPLVFGQPCKGRTKVYLKVIYTCVPRKVLNKQYEARVVEFTDVQMSPTAKTPHAKSDLGSHQVYHEMKVTTSSTMLQKDTSDGFDINCTETTKVEKNKVIGFLTQWINTYTYVAQNQEKFYLYLILSIGAGVVLCMSLLIVHLLVQRGRARRAEKHNTYSGGSVLPHGFEDDISVVDADIDLDLPVLPMRFSHAVLDDAVRSTTASATCEFSRGCHTLPRDMPRSLNASGTHSSFFYG